MGRSGDRRRETAETSIKVNIELDGTGESRISSGIPFFDHMLTLFAVHGFMDLTMEASGDLEVDGHHTVEDIGLTLGEALDAALGDRKGINRYGHAVTPMDDALAAVTIDLSKRPYLAYHVPSALTGTGTFDADLVKEFLRAFSVKGGMNLHVNVNYGENGHHILEAVFKSLGRALDQATALSDRVSGVRSSKGSL